MAKKVTPKKDSGSVYRSSETGKFVTKKYADKNPKTTTKETIKKGKGTSHTGPRRK